jgi:hypothetical protein
VLWGCGLRGGERAFIFRDSHFCLLRVGDLVRARSVVTHRALPDIRLPASSKLVGFSNWQLAKWLS